MAGLWPNGLYGAGEAMVTFTEDEDGAWAVLLDAPWKEHGLDVGAFGGLFDAIAFVFGRGVIRLQLPLGGA
jgi:hypothetical protein